MVRSRGLALATLAATLALLGGVARPSRADVPVFPTLAPPSDVVPYPKDKAVFLTWTHLPDDALVGYNIYRRTADQKADQAVLTNTQGPITTTYGTDTGVTNGTAYIYNVKAVYKDAAGKLAEGLPSQDVPATAAKLPGPFALVTLDTNNLGTATVDANNIMTIRASGQDIWDDRTEGTFLVAPVAGDFRITVKLTERPKLEDPDNGDPAAKVGLVILFGGLHHGDKGETAYYYNSVTRDPEFLMEGRNLDLTNWGVSDNSPTSDETTFPAWLRITKKGQMVTAAFSEDPNGATFKDLGPPHDMGGALPALAYAGVAVTARKEHQWVIGKIDLNTLKIEPAP
jgi:hypothetical protein